MKTYNILMKCLIITLQNTCNEPQNFLPVLELAYFETKEMGIDRTLAMYIFKKTTQNNINI